MNTTLENYLIVFTGNQIINVECRAWAKNIQYSSHKSEKKGAVHFELMVDE